MIKGPSESACNIVGISSIPEKFLCNTFVFCCIIYLFVSPFRQITQTIQKQREEVDTKRRKKKDEHGTYLRIASHRCFGRVLYYCIDSTSFHQRAYTAVATSVCSAPCRSCFRRFRCLPTYRIGRYRPQNRSQRKSSTTRILDCKQKMNATR